MEETSNNTNANSEILEQLRKLIVDLSGTPIDTDQASVTFMEMGLDSLVLTQISHAITNTFKVDISFRQLMREISTLQLLADAIAKQSPQLAKQMPVSKPAAQPVPNVTRNVSSGQVAAANVTVTALEQVIVQQAQTIDRLVRLLEQRDGGTRSLTPIREASELIMDSSHPPMPEARLGQDAEGNPAWFIPDPGRQGKFLLLRNKDAK
jgi:acyl carrier protein